MINTLSENAKNAKMVIIKFLSKYMEISFKENQNSLNSLVTPRDKIKEKTIDKLKNIMPDLLK